MMEKLSLHLSKAKMNHGDHFLNTILKLTIWSKNKFVFIYDYRINDIFFNLKT